MSSALDSLTLDQVVSIGRALVTILGAVLSIVGTF